jgi:hypothetical protein
LADIDTRVSIGRKKMMNLEEVVEFLVPLVYNLLEAIETLLKSTNMGQVSTINVTF